MARRLVENHTLNHDTQIRAWSAQVGLLQGALALFPGWRVLFEYPLVRLGRRIDVVLLSDRAIMVLEFKVGATAFALGDFQQVEDYALDLFDFHAASRRHPIIPILVATQAAPLDFVPPLYWHAITPVLAANGSTLAARLADIAAAVPPPRHPLDCLAWEHAAYRPVPTIVEAATMLYRRHGVAEIAAARADLANLTTTSDAIRAVIDQAATAGQHVVIFVTGIPGAGKTLCGLNAVFTATHEAAFLTGNLPLVHVLREALARDAKEGGGNLRAARHKLDGAVQPLLNFLKFSIPRDDPPHEHVIVFDEAQRAWDAAFGQRKFGLQDSEAALFLDIMRRHADWAVIVALVGSGQEINTGEAGLASWGTALAVRPEWHIVGPAEIIGNPQAARCLAATRPAQMRVDPALQLDVSMRQIRSNAAAAWVDALLRGQDAQAAEIARQAGGVPFRLTRSLAHLRQHLRTRMRGTRRAGLVCSAGAKRLRAEGLSAEFAHMDQDVVANWFLNRWPDVRASDALEMPATQYACQGLELDYVGLCWGGDLIRDPRHAIWQARKFRGTAWQNIRQPDAVGWLINTYRVLLTRARYETLIFVPEGTPDDPTRDPAAGDHIAAYLRACGAGELADVWDDPDPAMGAQDTIRQGALFA